MKKLILFLVLIAYAINARTQTDNQSFIISIQGDFTKSLMDIGSTTISNKTEGQYLNIDASLGFITKKGFTYGFGVDVIWATEDRVSEVYINRYIQAEKLEIKSNAIIPNIYFGYYYRITNNFYFNGNFKMGYGAIKREFENIVVSASAYFTDEIRTINEWGNYISASRYSGSNDFFNAGIYPQLNYFLKGYWGLCLTLGGIEYAITDWQYSTWTVSFKPVYWNFGIKFKF